MKADVTVICANCGAENPEGFRFCPACGSAISVPALPRQSRKVVTALLCDVAGSTALGEQLDPEMLRGVVNRYLAEIRATVEHHGGTVDRVVGDSIMAVFGIPTLHEDDALRAVRAAAEIRDRLPGVATEIGVTLRFRTGVNTGPVLAGEGENLVIGDAVNVAARLEQAAQPGEILLGSATLSLVRDAVEVEPLGPLRLKGKSEPIPAWRLLRLDVMAAGVARHMDAPLIGRERELHLLQEAWERVVVERGCHLFTLMGAAGVGKSRLVGELLAGICDRATVLRGRCLHYGDGITFWPLIEALMPVAASAQHVLERLGGGGSPTPEELFWEVRRLLEGLASELPVVWHVDDLQWGEPMLFDLLDHVADLSRGAPILLLCTARPELLDERSGWGGGKLNASTVLLEPLAAEASERLLDQLGDGLDRDARCRIVTAAEGNPLFLEEMATLAREGGAVELPPTIQALLAARLERLAVEERELLERGAVEGEVFHRLAVRALTGEGVGGAVEARLAGLVRKELIRPHPASFEGDEAFRFRHLLIRDAAYDGLPKATRADLHERFAAWLEEHGSGLVELDEIVGWHLEQVVRYRQDLSRSIEPALRRRAAERLLAAARRARDLSDLAAARNLFERAHEAAPAGDPLGVRAGVELAEQLVDAGELARADELLRAGEGDPGAGVHAALTRLEWANSARPEGAQRRIDSQLPEMIVRLTELGDERGLAKAHMAAFWAYWAASQALPASEELRLVACHAVRAGDNGLRVRALGWYSSALLWGPLNVDIVAREADAIESQDAGPFLTACVTLLRGEVARLRGEIDESRRITTRARDAFAALGAYVWIGGTDQVLARVELGAGNATAARDKLLRSDAVFARVGDRGFRSTTLALLAQAQQAAGDAEGARAAIALSEEIGGRDDVINFAITYGVRAQLALSDGDGEAAEQWARSAVESAVLTDFSFVRGDALLTLAQSLAAVGRRDEAMAQLRLALELFEGKGDRPGLAKARSILEQLSAR